MKRKHPVLRTLLWAALGAALTVIVAWACVLWDYELDVIGRDSSWPPWVPTGWPEAQGGLVVQTLGGRTQQVLAAEPVAAPGRGNRIWETCHGVYGLPLKSLQYRETWTWLGRQPGPRWIDGLAAPPALAEHDRVVLPIRPLWPGFALDTAFYGTLAFLLWSAPGFVRRTRRRRRGLCLACGYELKGVPKCPECGL